MSLKRKVDEISLKPTEYLLPLFEGVVNSLISFKQNKNKDGYIKIRIFRHKLPQQEALFGTIEKVFNPIKAFEIEDNAAGFTDKNFKSFNTAYSEEYARYGCKGVGRFTVLACFKDIKVKSIFKEEENFFEREFDFNVEDEVTPKDGNLKLLSNPTTVKTTVTINDLRLKFLEKSRQSIQEIAGELIDHCLLYFLSASAPTIEIQDIQNDEKLVLNDIVKTVITFDTPEVAFRPKDGKEAFNVYCLKNLSSKMHRLKLCANNRQVGKSKNLSEVSPGFGVPFTDNNETKYFVDVYVTSDYLDRKVNSLRNSFNFPDEDENVLFEEEFSEKAIHSFLKEKLEEAYTEKVESAISNNIKRIHNYINNPKKPRLQYRGLLRRPEILRTVPGNLSDEKLDEHLYKARFDLDRQLTKSLDQALKKRKIEDVEAYSSTITNILNQEAEFAKDQLADCLVRRKSILKVFKRMLELDSSDEYKLEKDIHNLIFTMGENSENVKYDDHNLWLLDERLAFHSYVASDKTISSLPLLDSDSRKEPDVTIFDFPWAYSDDPKRINSLVIFEFKRPGRDMFNESDKNLDSQVVEYFKKLSASRAKDYKGNYLQIQDNTPKFGYVICSLHKDLIDYNVKWNDFKETPYGSLYKLVPSVNLHVEVMNYGQLIEFSEKKHHAFFKELGIDEI